MGGVARIRKGDSMRWVYVVHLEAEGTSPHLAPVALTFSSRERAWLWVSDWLERHPDAQHVREGDAQLWREETAQGWHRLTLLRSPLL